MDRIRILGLMIVAMLLVPSLANAQSATSSFGVSATVTANCTITTVGIPFGAYDPLVANATVPLDSNGSVTVSCTSGAATTIGMDQGANPTGTSDAANPERQMTAGAADRLRHDLYQDAPRTTVWADVATPGVVTYNSTGVAPTVFTIFGRIPAGQDVEVGAYTDTVTATISF